MKLSIGRKLLISIFLIAVILGSAAMLVSNIVMRNMIDKKYSDSANELAATVGKALDKEQMSAITEKVIGAFNASETKLSNEEWEKDGYDEYVEQFSYLTDDPDYIAIRDSLRGFQELNSVDCMYTVAVAPDDKAFVYIVDAAEEDAVSPGCFDPIYEMNYDTLTDPERGFPAYITNTEEYGWLLTAGAPVYDAEGKVICYAMLDISMNAIRAEQTRFSLMLAGFLALVSIPIFVLTIFYVRRRIIKPINMLSQAAGQYGQNHGSSHREFSSLKIRTGDELEVLLGSMVQMERDIDNYILNLTQTKEQLSSARQQADDMQKQAYFDSLTGIRNRLAYDKEIQLVEQGSREGGRTEYGIAMIDLNYLKVINDTYGHEYGNAAIVSLSKLICDIFVHSPVFRIGGDEFAVILRNNDYDKIRSLEQEFNSKIERLREDDSLEPWEKLSAAFGYALYDPASDNSADDVFKRADKNMYERKKAMKAERE